jgi:hypothetical protein
MTRESDGRDLYWYLDLLNGRDMRLEFADADLVDFLLY